MLLSSLMATWRTMWLALGLLMLVFFTKIQAEDWDDFINKCKSEQSHSWTKCLERKIVTCTTKGRSGTFYHQRVKVSQEAERVLPNHRLHIPPSALRMCRGSESDEEVLLVSTVVNSSFFQPVPPPSGKKGRSFLPTYHRSGTVLDNSVLMVKAGENPVTNLLQPVRLTFQNNRKMEGATCVFWQETDLNNGTGYWSAEGCQTNVTGTQVVCSCDHLTFFAVLVNPVLSVDKDSAASLSYTGFAGSALSVFFTILALITYSSLQRRRPEKSVTVHLHLAGALLGLHLSFLLGGFWVSMLNENDEGWVCKGLGLLLHWSLLATYFWMALEGFHLYLLLVRVFNIYIKNYVLRLCLVAWGFPTLTVAICGSVGVYGKYSLSLNDNGNQNSTVQLCWIRSQFPHSLLVSYITTVAFPFLVVLFNSSMVCLVAVKLCGLRRRRSRGSESGDNWRKMNEDSWSRLWRNGATVLCLSCLLGVPWGLAGLTYISDLTGIYLFTVLNSLQGVFMFLWALALTCKSRAEKNSSVLSSSQKVTTTSFKN